MIAIGKYVAGRLKEASSLGGLGLLMGTLGTSMGHQGNGSTESVPVAGSMDNELPNETLIDALVSLVLLVVPAGSEWEPLVTRENFEAVFRAGGVLMACLAIMVPERGSKPPK